MPSTSERSTRNSAAVHELRSRAVFGRCAKGDDYGILIVIGLGGGGITSRAAGRGAAGRARRAGRFAGVFVLLRADGFAAAFALAGVRERTVAVGRFATGALVLAVAGGDVGTTAGAGAEMAAAGADAGGTDIGTGADCIGTGGAACNVGMRVAAAVAPESGTCSPSNPSMNGFAMQS